MATGMETIFVMIMILGRSTALNYRPGDQKILALSLNS